jgi:hypothetical protein
MMASPLAPPRQDRNLATEDDTHVTTKGTTSVATWVQRDLPYATFAYPSPQDVVRDTTQCHLSTRFGSHRSLRHYIRYHRLRHPAEMDENQVIQFLTHLAFERQVFASTQNQALPCVTRSQRTCWRAVTTSAPYRNCWDKLT